jgi:hypothetical protein
MTSAPRPVFLPPAPRESACHQNWLQPVLGFFLQYAGGGSKVSSQQPKTQNMVVSLPLKKQLCFSRF